MSDEAKVVAVEAAGVDPVGQRLHHVDAAISIAMGVWVVLARRGEDDEDKDEFPRVKYAGDDEPDDDHAEVRAKCLAVVERALGKLEDIIEGIQ